MPTLIVRDVDDRLHKRLKSEARRRRVSVNTLTKELLAQGVAPAVADAAGRYADLDALAGTWSTADARRFNEAIEPMSKVEPELWS
ncbi:MAG: hypothetical protein ING59_08245 [Burkholderiales bacterium]|jgi:hypothetical protein|nr:hypothetical protein [Burkholderiales bacterium]